ncbi:MAG: hypothetical protein AAF678_12020 [Pseudomonadota bacterium]
MKLWIILPDAKITDDRAYLVGYLKCAFDEVMITWADRFALYADPPPARPDVILNLVSARSRALLEDIDSKAAAFGVPVSPPARGSWRTEDKRTYLEDFSDVSPPAKIVYSMAEFEAARSEFGGDVVIKDPLGDRGAGVERVTSAEDSHIAKQMFGTTILGTEELIVQPYLSGFSKGDKRILLQRMPDNSFEIVAYICRKPPPGGWKSNIRAGGRTERTELTEEERALALSLAARTGVDNASIDIAEHDGRLWYIEHNQGYGGIIDYDLDRDKDNVRLTAAFLKHIAQHGRPDVHETPARVPQEMHAETGG